MALTDSLRILITANGAQAEREFQKVGAAAKKNLGQAEAGAERFGRQLTSAGVAMAVFGGVALVGLYKAAQAAQEEDLAIAKLNNSIANSPELAGASADAFLEQAAALQDLTTYSDDATIAAQAMLGTFHLTQSEILGLTPLVQDLASKFDMDLNRASILVGKAMDGNSGALGRMGVNIDEAAFATDRYSAVMTALRENAGGFAETEGATFNGQIEIMKNNLGDIAEGVGRGAVSAFNDLLGPVMAVSDAFQGLSPEVQATVGRVGTFGATGLVAAGGVSFLAGQVITAAQRFQTLRTAVSSANGAALAAYGPWAALAAILVGIQTGALDWTNALTPDELDTGAIDGMTAAMIEAGGAAEGLTDYVSTNFDSSWFDAAGVSADELSAALLGSGGAWDAFVTEVTGNLPEGADVGQWTDALELHRERALESRDALNEQGRSAELAALGLDENATSAEEAAARTDALVGSIDAYLARTQGVPEANDALQGSFNGLFQAVAENGAVWQGNSEAALENRAALREVVAAHVNLIGKMVDNEASQERLNEVTGTTIDRLRASRDAGLITGEQFVTLRRQVLNVPGVSITEIRANNRQALDAIAEATRKGEEFARKNFTAHLSIMDSTGSQTGGMGSGDAQFNSDGTPRSRERFPTADEIGRATAEHMQKRPLMTVGVG